MINLANRRGWSRTDPKEIFLPSASPYPEKTSPHQAAIASKSKILAEKERQDHLHLTEEQRQYQPNSKGPGCFPSHHIPQDEEAEDNI